MGLIKKPLHRYSSLDSGALCRLFRKKDVYIPSGDDYTMVEDIQRFIDNALASEVIYVLGRSPKKEAVIFAPSHNVTTFQAHMAFDKDNRKNVVNTVIEAGLWLVDHTDCKSVISFIKEDNLGARSVLSQLGMKRRGRLKRSALVNGEYVDELIYQVNLKEFLEMKQCLG